MSFLQQELAKLMSNDRQREAYLYDDNCVVQAGPGSGKTAVLTLKVMRLLAEEIPPPRGLACLTFNNEAVREFKNRLRKLGLPRRPNVFLGTVHSFCLSCVIVPFGKLFRPDLPSPLRVAPDAISRACLQKAMDYVEITEHPAQFRSRFERYRRSYLDRSNREWLTDEDCANAIEQYESLLHQRGCVDFDDLILVALKMIESQPLVRRCLHARYPWLVIDEYQDLGYPLHQIVLNLLANTDVKIFAVGDPDQSIYGFTGADPKYLRELAGRADVKSIRLSLNYRCGQKIIDGAEVILSPPTPRGYTSSRRGASPGEIHFVVLSGGLEQQADAIAKIILPELKKTGYDPKETAILYIDRNDASVIVKALECEKVKYAGERDQRYRRTPVTRWVEEIAQWCCGIRGNDGVRFGDISDYWIRLLRSTETAIAEETLLLHITSFLGCLLELQKPHMLLNQWLVKLDRRLSLKTKLATLREWPDEIDAFESMVAA